MKLRRFFSLSAACATGLLTFAMAGADPDISELMKREKRNGYKAFEKPSLSKELVASFLMGAMAFFIAEQIPSLWPKKSGDDDDWRGDDGDDNSQDKPKPKPSFALMLSCESKMSDYQPRLEKYLAPDHEPAAPIYN